jgi:hypothetical protein
VITADVAVRLGSNMVEFSIPTPPTPIPLEIL